MKLPIRVKLFIGMSCLVLLYSGLSLLLNSQYLGTYYLNQKKSLLIETSQFINDNYTGDPADLDDSLEYMETTYGVIIHIIGSDGSFRYNSIQRLLTGNPFNGAPPQRRHSPFVLRAQEQIDAAIKMETLQDPVLRRDYITVERKLPNEDILTLRIPLAAITDSVTIVNHFTILSSIIVILLGSIWTVYYSRRFTRPILELSDIAQAMAHLDFSKRAQHTGGDEIGALGKSLNYLSKQLESAIDELNIKNRQLQADIKRERELDQMRKEFVSNVSHELKTPLALILGYAEGLRENVNADEENKNFYCEVIIDEACKMDKLVKDLLNLAQLEFSGLQLQKSRFNLADLLAQVLRKYQSIFNEQGIRLMTGYEPVLAVCADETKIEQVLVNFINNALQHVNEQKLISLQVQSLADKFRVFVVNSGGQIPAASLEKIWTSFYKADPARAREDGGVGLGLAIVRAIQERHGNLFGTENTEEGVSFWFDIDRAG